MANLIDLITGNSGAKVGVHYDRVRDKLRAFWGFTESLASLSRCRRLRVGCVIIRPDFSEVLAVGYNGPPRGVPNDSCRDGAGVCGCIHCEANGLI
jgi:deoxycytidylate deaminase